MYTRLIGRYFANLFSTVLSAQIIAECSIRQELTLLLFVAWGLHRSFRSWVNRSLQVLFDVRCFTFSLTLRRTTLAVFSETLRSVFRSLILRLSHQQPPLLDHSSISTCTQSYYSETALVRAG